MTFVRYAVAATLIVALGACSPSAFVDRREMDQSIKKPKLPGYDGNVNVCYDNETPRAERDRLAAEACQVYGLQAKLVSEQRWQCRMTAPHTASYRCFDPEMRMADGNLVDPFSAGQVKAWRQEHKAEKAAPAER